MFSYSPHSPTPDEFAELVAESLISRGSANGQLVFDRRGFALLLKGPQGQPNKQISLNDFYHDYCLSDVQKREEILLQASLLGEATKPAINGKRSNFTAHVLDRWSAEKLRLAHLQVGATDSPSGRKSTLPYMVLADHFAILLSDESAVRSSYVTTKDLEASGTTFDDAVFYASENIKLAGQVDVESLIHADTDEMILHSSTSNTDGHLARALLSKKFGSLTVPGQHLVFLINPNYILVTGTRSERGLMYAYSELRPTQGKAGALPPFPILLEEGRYSRYRVPQDSLWHHFFREMELRYFCNTCRAQEELLQNQFNHLIQGSHLAQYEMARDDDGKLFSYCAVNERTMPILIPKTDYICFQNRNGRAASTSLSRLLKDSPNIFEKTDFYPARYLMSQFPDAAQLAQIGHDARFA